MSAAATFPIGVLMERQPVTGNRWIDERWEAVGVVAGEAIAEPAEPRLVHTDGTLERYLHPGFALELHRDDAPSYYSNLMASNPSVFIVCRREDDATAPEPFLVSVSYGEASAFMEGEEEVFAAPMPPEIYRWVEAYVLEHYVPEAPRKRKREDWKKGGGRRGH